MNPLREKRIELGLSLQQIADRIGVSKMTVSEWERNLKYPMVNKLLRIQKVYEMTDEELIKYIEYCGEEESGK